MTLVLSLLTLGSQLMSRIKVQFDKEDAAQLLLAPDVQCPLAGSMLTIRTVSDACLRSRSRKMTGSGWVRARCRRYGLTRGELEKAERAGQLPSQPFTRLWLRSAAQAPAPTHRILRLGSDTPTPGTGQTLRHDTNNIIYIRHHLKPVIRINFEYKYQYHNKYGCWSL